ncbi:MAG: radical SAM protein [Myxococcales bacterium]|nr:radical SAM protein [Myxococcales bacterium]
MRQTNASTIATFDLTSRCPLRCRHCYVREDLVEDLDDDTYIARLVALRDAHQLRSALWVGGEPLLRLPLLRRATSLFARNAVSTSAALPVPPDLGAGLLVSVEGPRDEHELLRGRGTFDDVLANIGELEPGSFALSTTLTAPTLAAIDALGELVDETRALGVLVGFYVGPPGDPLSVRRGDRNWAVDRLHALQAKRPGVVLNTPAGLDRLRAENARELARSCIYRRGAMAFDSALERKRPCTFGARANCGACGCAVVAEQVARALDTPAAGALLAALFPVRPLQPPS